MRTYAIGDVHGCANALQTLLDFVQPSADDRLIFLGDYVDRGPNSCGVLTQLLALSANPNHVFLRGNHDDWLLTARTERKMFQSWLAVGGRETLDSYGAKTIEGLPPQDLEFLENTRFYFEDEFHIYAHAAVTATEMQFNAPRWLMWGNLSAVTEHPSGKRIVLGHSAQRNGVPLDKGFLVCVDTHAYGNGFLTAFDVGNDTVFQANEAGQTRRFHLGEIP